MPWHALINLIEPHYPRSSKKGGRPPYPLATWPLASAKRLLRIHLMQQWYSLGDPGLKVALIEVPAMRRFAGIDMISERIPGEMTILAFRHLLERHQVGEQIYCFAEDFVYGGGESPSQGTRHVHEAGRAQRA